MHILNIGKHPIRFSLSQQLTIQLSLGIGQPPA